jgi:hypothetical protein
MLAGLPFQLLPLFLLKIILQQIIFIRVEQRNSDLLIVGHDTRCPNFADQPHHTPGSPLFAVQVVPKDTIVRENKIPASNFYQ